MNTEQIQAYDAAAAVLKQTLQDTYPAIRWFVSTSSSYLELEDIQGAIDDNTLLVTGFQGKFSSGPMSCRVISSTDSQMINTLAQMAIYVFDYFKEREARQDIT